MSSCWLCSCSAHHPASAFRDYSAPWLYLGDEIKELLLCPESFWGSSAVYFGRCKKHISGGCFGVGKQMFWACSARTGSRSCKPETVLAPVGISWEYPGISCGHSVPWDPAECSQEGSATPGEAGGISRVLCYRWHPRPLLLSGDTSCSGGTS